MTKKQILWLLLFLLLLILAYFFGCPTPSKPAVVINDARPKEFIVSYKTRTNYKVREDLILKGYKLKDTCACSQQIELYEAPTNVIPETTDVRSSGGGGTNGTGNGVPTIIRNYIVQDTLRAITIRGLGRDTPVFIQDTLIGTRYPQPPNTATTQEVIIAIVDSGVDEFSMAALERGANPLSARLYRDYSGVKFCGTNVSESSYGMNILKAMISGSDPLVSSNPIDEDGHGTFINGVIAGVATPYGDFIGASRNVRFKQLNVKFLKNRNTAGDLFTALCGVHYALGKEAKVINASWRSLTVTGGDETNIKEFFLPTLEAIKNKNVLLVTGSGNDAYNLDLTTKAWPACFSKDINYGNNVITVGAWNRDSTKIAFFSNFGSYVDVYAPGADIFSIGLDDSTQERAIMKGQGTSYSTPYVVRTAAILIGTLPAGTPMGQIKERIIATTIIPSQNNTVRLLHYENAVQNIRH
jgi:subtilisin family serine protease